MKTFLIALALFIGAGALARAGEPVAADDFLVTLESLDGASEVEATTPDGKIRQVHVGGEIERGEKITVPAGAAAHVAFEEGAQVLASSSAAFSPARENGVPAVTLDAGAIRTLVEPAPTGSAASTAPVAGVNAAGAPAPKKPFRFLVRTRAAVLGVRGTDFVTEADPQGGAAVHTLNGLVEMGQDSAELHQGSGVRLGPGQFTEARHGQRIAPARPFEASKYLAEFHHRHPRLEGMHRSAAQRVRSGMMRERFNKLRATRRRNASGAGPHKKVRQPLNPKMRQELKNRKRQGKHPGKRQGKRQGKRTRNRKSKGQ